MPNCMSDGVISKDTEKWLEEIMGLVGYVKVEGLMAQQGDLWPYQPRMPKKDLG